MRVLISGMGIAGPTLAYWLCRGGVEVTLVEEAPAFRTGGYVIDFWGAGLQIAERMGVLPELRRQGYLVREVRMVDAQGQRVSGFDTDVFRRLTDDRFFSIARGDLAATIYRTVEDRVESVFGDSIASLQDGPAGVEVRFARGGTRQYDLVVGADGLHSNVRSLAFGPEEHFEKYLGYGVAAFEASGYRPRDEDVYVMHTEVGRQVARFAMRGDRTLFLFVFGDRDRTRRDPAAQRALLRERFGSSGWECPGILAAMENVPELYFDRVSQIRMDRWWRGRVALVGDAAFCVSLLAGQGSALAMVAAYVLAGELASAPGDHERAFERYQARLADFIRRKQEGAAQFAGYFAPRSRLRLFLRNQVTKLLAIPPVARLSFGRDLADRVELPDY